MKKDLLKENKGPKIAALVTGAMTVVICAVMNLILIPGIERAGGGIRCFDMSPGAPVEQHLYFLDNLSLPGGAAGKSLYLNVQLPLDFVYPLVYAAFFILLIYLFFKRKSVLFALPTLLAASDYGENVCILLLLKSENPTRSLIQVCGVFTIVKTALLCVCAALLLTLLLIALFRLWKQKNKEAGPKEKPDKEKPKEKKTKDKETKEEKKEDAPETKEPEEEQSDNDKTENESE